MTVTHHCRATWKQKLMGRWEERAWLQILKFNLCVCVCVCLMVIIHPLQRTITCHEVLCKHSSVVDIHTPRSNGGCILLQTHRDRLSAAWSLWCHWQLAIWGLLLHLQYYTLLTKLHFTSDNSYCWLAVETHPSYSWRRPFEGWNVSEWHSVNKEVLIINVGTD